MSITDELREYVKAKCQNVTGNSRCSGMKKILAIADRIDERHEDIIYDYQREYEDFKSYRDIAYVELPVDADGVPIRVGDTIEIEHNGRVTTVTNINYNEHGWQVYCAEGGGFDKDTRCRHVEPDTWERIIEDALLESHWDEPSPDDDDYERCKRVRDMVISELVERCRRLADGD